MVLEFENHNNVADATVSDQSHRNSQVTWETGTQMYRLITLGSNPVRYFFFYGSQELNQILLRLLGISNLNMATGLSRYACLGPHSNCHNGIYGGWLLPSFGSWEFI